MPRISSLSISWESSKNVTRLWLRRKKSEDMLDMKKFEDMLDMKKSEDMLDMKKSEDPYTTVA
jgi:hypothetical protein